MISISKSHHKAYVFQLSDTHGRAPHMDVYFEGELIFQVATQIYIVIHLGTLTIFIREVLWPIWEHKQAILSPFSRMLILVRTNLNYCVQGPSNTAILLSNDHSLYTPFTSGECHILFYLYGFNRPARSALQAKYTKWKILTHFGNRIKTLRIVIKTNIFCAKECLFLLHCNFPVDNSSEWLEICSLMLYRMS